MTRPLHDTSEEHAHRNAPAMRPSRPRRTASSFASKLFAIFVVAKAITAAGSAAGRGGKMYFAIASAGTQAYSRAFNKTLANLGYNVSVETLLVELPETGTFSSRFLQNVCERFEGNHVVAVLVVGDSRAAFTVALAAGHAGVPVLWARGTHSFLPGFNNLELSPFEVYLEPTARELMEALRALFIQTHWHSFTILADDSIVSSVLLRQELIQILEEPPLHPTVVQLPSFKQPHALFRRLADMSRSTRGVVILMCGRQSAARVLHEARRFNMVDGHFVWLWIDTKPVADSKNRTSNATDASGNAGGNFGPEVFGRNVRRKRTNRLEKNELGNMQLDHLVKNDQRLLFQMPSMKDVISDSKHFHPWHPSGVSKRKKFDDGVWRITDDELPVGLLSIRALPMRIDRHLVKGAVRLLVGTLKAVLAKCPQWITLETLTTSCWTPVSAKEFNFSAAFSRELKIQCADALAGKKTLQENGIERIDKSLVSNFEISNLVPETTNAKETEAGETDTVPPTTGLNRQQLKWRTVGRITGRIVHLDTIVWPGGGIVVAGLSNRARSMFRVVTALAPPFVMEGELDEDGQCLRGLPCHRVLTHDKDNLTLVFNEMETEERMVDEAEEDGNSKTERATTHEYNNNEGEDKFLPFRRYKYRTNCCYGLAMDLLENVAHELEFDFRLYIVADGLFGTKVRGLEKKRMRRSVEKAYLNYKFRNVGIYKGGQKLAEVEEEEAEEEDDSDSKWNGIVGDLASGAAHMSFAALSVSSARSEVIDYSAPFFFSGVSFLAAPKQKSEIPLMAFLLPFSPELWIAIFTSLNITAVAVAVYEWLSPFGLNPWGRQRSKNFSMSSALWVMWGLLCGHLVAFKAPKSWPNKFLINVWGGFSVIFVASYTANIAALIAGLFFQNTVSDYHDRSLLSQRVGAPRASAAEYYVKRTSKLLWDHMHRYALENVADGIKRLRNGSLDILIADTPILDYYRATDHGCTLQKVGDTFNEDTYAVGMTKGFPLKDSISAVIAKYSSNGYIDILQEKWYGGLPCFKLVTEIAQPRPLGVAAVTGVFILLGVGIFLGFLILLVEHLFYRYTLPILRHKPKGTIWRSRNIMFFSQKLYRFINCVELVSPHHAARELVHTLRQGQITSLFQKSVKRKEHEQRRRRKSKAQFFEMIQEIRRQQQESRQQPPLASLTEVDQEYQLSPDEKRTKLSPNIIRRTFMRSSPKMEQSPKVKSPTIFSSSLFSPRSQAKTRSQTALNVRRFSTDSVFNSQTFKLDRSSAIGRRLSKDASFLSGSPPDINSRRSSYLDMINSSGKLSGKSPVLSIENVSECESVGRKLSGDFRRKYSDAENIGRKLATLPKFRNSLDTNRLHPGDRLTVGKSDETLTKTSSAPNYGTIKVNDIITAKSFQSIPDTSKKKGNDTIGAKSIQNIPDTSKKKLNDITGAKSFQSISDTSKKDLEVEVTLDATNKGNLSDDEISRRNKVTIEQLKTQLTKSDIGKTQVGRTQSNSATIPPRIQVEDTTKPRVERKVKHRHRSLGEAPKPLQEAKKSALKPTDHSQSLDSNPALPAREAFRKRTSKCFDHDLPPAPPPPNCSPRSGRSPLERLSKDELVNLWRSSESELRSHLLKAIRDKKEADDPP